jgi:hypothetical protein
VVSLDLHDREGVLPATAARVWGEGGVLAAGLVPATASPGELPDPATGVSRWLALAAAVGDVDDLAGRTLVTATCGLAGVDEAAAAASFATAAEVGRRIRRLDRPTTAADRRLPWAT